MTFFWRYKLTILFLRWSYEVKDKYASDVVLCLILYEINEPKIQL